LSAESGTIDLEIELAQQKARAAEAERETAQLSKDAEDERLARVKLEEAVAWRRLTKSQIAEMGSVLAAYPKQLTALVYNVSDLEAYGFAMDIDVCLT